MTVPTQPAHQVGLGEVDDFVAAPIENGYSSVQTAAKTYFTALEALTERQEKSAENGVPKAHVTTLPVRITTCFCRMRPKC
ncbi:MAG: hypothetical protein ABSG96_09800 [Terracidiphilus sp.]|jgi:(p)ppGpp synthase/HD superfamily hydrolase